jgi:sodium transport system permease protein
MSLKSLPTIYRKEMLDTIRDRRTLISMVAVPALAIPLMFTVIGAFMNRMTKKAGEEAVTVAVHGADRLPGLLNALAGARCRFVEKRDLKAAVLNKEIAAGVEPVPGPGGAIEVRIYSDRSRQASEVASRNIREALGVLKENTVKFKVRSLGLPDTVMNPFTVKSVNLSPEKMAGMLWGSMLGYVVVLLMFSGGMYPAIDLTAGEKERRTLEVYLSSPAGRDEIILGKILATTTAVFCTALLSITSLVVSFRYSSFGKLDKNMQEMIGNIPLDGRTLALVLVSLLPTAIMAASLMIGIALMAKSFKEAQSYLTPLIMAVVFPLIIGMLPGLQLTPALALIPLFNICQLIKEIFQGDFSRTAFFVTLAANFAYAALAFFGAVRVFKNEKVLFRT